MYFLGTFESGDSAQFTSASGAVQNSVAKEDTWAGLNEDNENFIKNINTDYGLADIAKTYAGAWFRWTGTIANDWYVMLGNGAASQQWELKTLTGSKLKLTVNGVTYNGTVTLVANTWHFIMVEFYCHDSAGYAKVYVDGVLAIDTGTIDSKTGTDTGVRQIKWQGTNSASVNCYVDDCLFSDTDPNFGIKVSKAGKEATCLDVKNLSFISNAFFLKFHGEYTTSAVFNPGDMTVTAEITHGLGYVPAFMAYGVRDDDNATFIIPSIPYGISEFDYAEAWADTNKIYFKVTLFDNNNGEGWNQKKYAINDFYNSFFDSNTSVEVGNEGGTQVHGAMRFVNIVADKNESLYAATINYYVGVKGGGAGDLKVKTHGIDEDNTGSFSGSPLGRDETSAYTTNTISINAGEYFGINVKTQLEEILARAGWASGNAAGFKIYDNGSPNDVNAYDGSSGTNGYLDILRSGTLTVNFRVIVFKDKIAT